MRGLVKVRHDATTFWKISRTVVQLHPRTLVRKPIQDPECFDCFSNADPDIFNYQVIDGKYFTLTKMDLEIKKSVCMIQNLRESDLFTARDFLYFEI